MWHAERQLNRLASVGAVGRLREASRPSTLPRSAPPSGPPPPPPSARAKYRSAGRYDDAQVRAALELLAINDFSELQRARNDAFPRGKSFTWAALAQGATSALGEALLEGGDDDTLEDCSLLASRLESRDASKSARVTSELRGAIDLVTKSARAVAMLQRVADGRAASDRDAMQATTLRALWRRLREAYGAGDDAWIIDVVQRASGRVLASDASGLVKSLFARAVAQWSPPPPVDLEPPPKRAKGTKVEWSDDEDF
jgi:hypothetical protein